jgi:hypothetical protein
VELFGGSIDYVAVIAAAVVSFFFGVIWYAPPLLGKYWIEKSKQGNSAQAGIGKTIGSAIISSLLVALVVEVLVTGLGILTWSSALELAVLIWVGFYFTKEFASAMSGDKPMKVFVSIVLHDIIALLLIATVLILLN